MNDASMIVNNDDTPSEENNLAQNWNDKNKTSRKTQRQLGILIVVHAAVSEHSYIV